MNKSISYNDYLRERLKNLSYAAIYLETHLEDDQDEFDPQLLKLAFTQVLDALGECHLTPEMLKMYQEKLDEYLSQPTNQGIYGLANWLKSLGLKLTIVVDEANHSNLADSQTQDLRSFPRSTGLTQI